nr:immunoglobulin light chain junction region [Macaca mulatta]MOW31404.1 immunoglobulin light chain junction region [Macaca mulatta]MOW31883.1 immunoglobulin light chain junction region [Macaca mulatta]
DYYCQSADGSFNPLF